MRDNLSDLISAMERKTDLQVFDKKYPNLLPASVADLKAARNLIYRALERLNFPDKFQS